MIFSFKSAYHSNDQILQGTSIVSFTKQSFMCVYIKIIYKNPYVLLDLKKKIKIPKGLNPMVESKDCFSNKQCSIIMSNSMEPWVYLMVMGECVVEHKDTMLNGFVNHAHICGTNPTPMFTFNRSQGIGSNDGKRRVFKHWARLNCHDDFLGAMGAP